ncbi:MAG TPA: YihY/virulence factor BrkB family protein [Verrucomicrobiae bacterium]|jgi:membrane protein|nr:YihY/virulence factor BrkB family protein [Verrucomicrobiae bacterium]
MKVTAREKKTDKDKPPKTGFHIAGLHWRYWAHCLWRRFSKDQVNNQAAQLAYYFFFALFPLLLCLTALLGMFVAPGGIVRNAVSQYLGAVLPGSASAFVETGLEQVAKGSSAGKLSFGLFVALWSASSGMSAIINGLNLAYEEKTERPWWREKLLAIGLTLAVTALMVTALLLIVCGGDLATTLATRFGWQKEFTLMWRVVQWPVLLCFVLGAFGLIYYYGPHCPNERLRSLLPGTLTGVAMWLLVSFLFRYYVHHFSNYNVTYGSIGAIIVLMLWFYLSSLAILIGGEINSIIEHAHEEGKARK